MTFAVPAFLETFENTALSSWIRESDSVFAYYFVLAAHNVGLALLVGSCAVLGARLLGFVPELPWQVLRRLFIFIWFGFWLNVVSGIFLVIAYPTKALTNPLFYVKLLLVVIGAVALRRLQRETDVKRSLTLWMLASWFGVLAAGRALAYTATYILYGRGA